MQVITALYSKMKNTFVATLIVVSLLLIVTQETIADCREVEDIGHIKVSAKQRNSDELIEVIIDAPTFLNGNRLESVVLVIGDIDKPDYIVSLNLFETKGRSKLVLDGKLELIRKSMIRARYFNDNSCYKVLLVALSQVKIDRDEN